MFHLELACPNGCPWTPPANWTGDHPAYYHDFESLDCVELINGAQHTNDGKVIFDE